MTESIEEYRCRLISLIKRAEYVCHHRFGKDDPVGTRVIAVGDLAVECDMARKWLDETQFLHPMEGSGTCAKCGDAKATPYRRDDLGGYVCLTCVENYLNETLELLRIERASFDEFYEDNIGTPPTRESETK